MIDLTPKYVINPEGLSPADLQELHKNVQFNYYKRLAETLATSLSDGMLYQAVAYVTGADQSPAADEQSRIIRP